MIGVYVCAGLGNRLFQIVFAFALAKKLSVSFKFENPTGRHHHSTDTYDWLIQRFLELPNYEKKETSYNKEYREDFYSFTSYINLESLDFKSKNIICYGFFQNENYFKQYREDILKLLKEPDEVIMFIQSYPKDLLRNAYFLHIRLGDYIGCSKHWIDLSNYYLSILERLEPTDYIVVFSNEIDKIQDIYPDVYNIIKSRNHIFIREPDEIKNLYLMKHCYKGGICSNSTFSWWGAWLNENSDKKIYFPKKWLQDENFIPDIYFEGSTVIDV